MGRGVFCAADENNDGFADIVRFMFRQRVFPTNIVVLTDSDRTMFVTDINGKVYKLTDQTGSGLADAKFREYFVPATDAILPLTADAFWLGSASYPNALLSQLEMNGQRISLPSSDSTPGAGRSIISMAKGQNDSLYLVDMIEGVLRRIPNTTPFSFLDWSRPAIMTKEYPTAVKVASDGRGRIFLLIAGVDRFLPPEPSSGPQAPPQTISVQSKIVVFRETSGALVREQEIIPGLGPWQVPFSPFNGLAVKGENVYAISTTYSQDGPVSEIHRINLQTKQATRFLSTYDVGNVLLTGLAVMGN
ncbi:MAG: hypothetical protein Q8R08_03340 [bacterium]|nr:hypothetical protein [bacterium]